MRATGIRLKPKCPKKPTNEPEEPYVLPVSAGCCVVDRDPGYLAVSASTRTFYESTAGRVAVDSLTKQILMVGARLLALPKFGNESEEPPTATQGSYRPRTSYSGSTHTGCAAVDLTAYNWQNRLMIFDLLGADFFHRLKTEGDWPEHGHMATRGMGCAAPSLKGQLEAVRRGKNGLANNGPDRDATKRSKLWPLAVFNGRTGKVKALQGTNLRDGPAYSRKIVRPAPKGTLVNAIMEVNVDGDRWFVTDQGEFGFSGKWVRV